MSGCTGKRRKIGSRPCTTDVEEQPLTWWIGNGDAYSDHIYQPDVDSEDILAKVVEEAVIMRESCIFPNVEVVDKIDGATLTLVSGPQCQRIRRTSDPVDAVNGHKQRGRWTRGHSRH